MSPLPKKTANISTVRATPQEKENLRKLVKELGFNTVAHFFRHAMETLFKQISLGQELVWPLRFEQKKREKPRRNKRA